MKKRELQIIGKAPMDIEKESILSYFLHVFEFTWSTLAYENKRENLNAYFSEQANLLKPNHATLSAKKEWWLYILITFRDVALYNSLDYAVGTVENMIKRIDFMSEELLERQVNELQNAFYHEVPDILLMRPLEMERLSCSIAEADHFLLFFLQNKEKFVSILEKMLRQKDIKKDYYEEFMRTGKKINKEYSSFWNGYYEIFIHYFISLYDFFMPFQTESFEEERDSVEKMILSFFTTSVATKEKIEDVSDEFLLILEKFIREDGNWDS